jgi:hypothetical protein
MPLSDTEFAAILSDAKSIQGDIFWQEDEDHSPSVQFRADITSQGGWDLFVQGRYNRRAGKLTYVIVLRTAGRIFGLCVGIDHHNPRCNQVGETHMHQWSEQYRDKEAFVPNSITAPFHDPLAVWGQFCAEAGIRHVGGNVSTSAALGGRL